MDLGATEAAMVVEEGSGSWSSSTNWVAAEGSLQDSISFETSDEDAPALTSSGLLLVRPSSDYPPPCEVTILFREKHEIHRVYVRSTARVYEIYYAADQQNKSKEYLCTVHCGPAAAAAVREVMPPSSSEGDMSKSQNGNDGTIEKHQKMARNDSNNSVEDGWVEVKVPDSPQQNDQANAFSEKVDGNSSTNFQIHYEATAEISDASPCAALTLRLLSLQTKACVHVEEIYIYADPVDSPNHDPYASMEGNLSGNPLLAMLVPGLLQLSKSGTSRIQRKYFSVDSEVREHQHCVDKAAEQSRLDMCGSGLQQANCGMMQQNLGLLQEETKVKSENIQLESGQNVIDQIDHNLGPVQEQTVVKPENVQLQSSQRVTDQADQELGPVQIQTEVEPENIHLGSNCKVTDMDQVRKSVVEENKPACGHVEKVLDELVTRIGRIEAFCSRFEKSMMKPLSSIEMRLQQLEQRFDAFAAGIQYSERNPCSRISAPEFSFDESDSENKGCNISFTVGEVTVSNDSSFPAYDVAASVPESKLCPGLAVKALESHNEDDSSLSSMDGATSMPESNMRPGLVVKAPEFLNEDEEFPHTDGTSDSSVKDCPGDNAPQSIDAALASALAAFLTSTTVKSPKCSPNVMEKPHWFSNGINKSSDFSSVSVSSGGSDKSFSKIDLEKKGFGAVKETNHGDSLLSADVAGAPDTSLDESYLENKGCDASDAARNIAAFGGSSLLADNTNSSVSVPQISGLILRAPEFPNEEDDFIDCDNTLDSGVENCSKDQESVLATGKSSLTLPAFLSSTKVISPKQKSTPLGATLELFSGDSNELARCHHTITSAPDPMISPDNNELASSSVEIPCRVGSVGTANHGNNMESKVDLDQIFNYLPSDGGLEHGEHAKLRHENCSTEPTVGGSTADCVPLKGGMEQNDHFVKWDRSSSTEATAMEEAYFAQKVPYCMGFQSNGGISNKRHDGSFVDDGDAEEAAHGNPCLNQPSREWTEDCSTDSSFEENFIKSKVQIYWSDESSTDSFGRSFAVDQQSGQAANNEEGSQALVDDFSIGIGLNSADSKSSADLKWAFDSKLDYEDRFMDFKFVPARDWGTRLPLELLLGETSDAEVQVSTAKDVDDGNCIAGGQQHDLFLSQWEDQSSTAVNQLPVGVELRVPSETCLWDADLHGPESSNQQPFSSLI